MKEKRFLLISLGVLLGVLFLEFPGTRLFDPDESRYGEISREMLVSGDFVTPTLNGSRYLEKPPMLYWIEAASMAILGQNSYAARLPARLAALGVVALMAAFLSAPLGLWSAIVYLSAPLPFALGRINITDGLVTLFLTLAFFCLWKILRDEGRSKKKFIYEVGLGVGAGLAVMTKGLIGIVFPGAVLFLWAAINGVRRILPRTIFSWAVPAFLIVVVPWFFMMERVAPGFSKFFFIHEHFQRFATTSARREAPGYFFIGIFILGFFPWIGIFVQSVREFISGWTKKSLLDADGLFFTLWFIVPILFFSFSQSKLIPYILPSFPAAAILVGRWISTEKSSIRLVGWPYALGITILSMTGLFLGYKSGFLNENNLSGMASLLAVIFIAGSWVTVLVGVRLKLAILTRAYTWGAVFFLLTACLPRIAHNYSDHDLAVAARASGADLIVTYRTYSQSFPWELKRTIPVVNFQGELASDGIKSPDLFWSEEEFWKRWYSGEKMAVCLRRGEEDDFNSLNSRESVVLGRNKSSLVLANFSKTPVDILSDLNK